MIIGDHVLPNNAAEFCCHFLTTLLLATAAYSSAIFLVRTHGLFYHLAGRALAGREHTKLIRICESPSSDKVGVTLLHPCASHNAFTLGIFFI